MERHKEMFKENSHFLSPRQFNEVNRDIQQRNRAKKRDELFFNSRNLVWSPSGFDEEDFDDKTGERISATSTPDVTSKKSQNVFQEITTKTKRQSLENKENKENINIEAGIKEEQGGEGGGAAVVGRPSIKGSSGGLLVPTFNQAAVEKHISRVAKAAVKDNGKFSRQEAYLKRFVEWKQKKKQQEELRKSAKKAPLFPSHKHNANDQEDNAVGEEDIEVKTSVSTAYKSFAPENHKFKPPEGLIDPTKDRPVIISQKRERQSLYTVVPTPPKKNINNSLEKKKPTAMPTLARRALMANTKPFTTRATSRERPVESNAKPLTTRAASRERPLESNVKPFAARATSRERPPDSNVKPFATRAASRERPPDSNAKPFPVRAASRERPFPVRATSKERPDGKPSTTVCKPFSLTKRLENAKKYPKIPSNTTGTTTKTQEKKPPIHQPVQSTTNLQRKALFTSNKNLVTESCPEPVRVPNTRSNSATRRAALPTLNVPKTSTTKPPTQQKVIKEKAGGLRNAPLPPSSRPNGFLKPEPKGALVKTNSSGAVGKAQRLLQTKKSSALEGQKKPKLSLTMKAKNVSNSKVITNKKPSAATEAQKMMLIETESEEYLNIQTPTLENEENDNNNKNNSFKEEELPKIEEPAKKKKSGKSTARKAILQNVSKARKEKRKEREENLKKKAENEMKKEEGSGERISPKIKYNFIYKFESSDIETTILDPDQQPKQEEDTDKKTSPVAAPADQPLTEAALDLNETPKTILDKDERPSNYVSPFVTVSRGKVSLKAEKERRNSVYLQDENVATPDQSSPEIAEQSLNQSQNQNQTPVQVKRIMEAVKHFRQQLANEIERLHALCDKWEVYRDENLAKLQETGGDDMINVTIGQTKLLTSKKFMQFKGLIDRCEAGATGIGAVPDDGSEDTKPITAIDLEGFWSMVGLQVENVEKRFENLEKWKANDWLDPQEVKPKTKKNLTKVAKKPKAAAVKPKANSGVMQFIKKLQQDMKNKMKETNGGNNEAGPLNTTPKLTRRSSLLLSENNKERTPKRISILVKDRKSFSNSPTIITIHSPSSRRFAKAARRSSLTSPKKVRKSLRKDTEGNDLLKAALLGAAEEKSKLQTPPEVATTELAEAQSPPRTVSRKSILKTPGTAKDKSKSVIFNDKLQVRQFKFAFIEPTSDGEDEDDNEDHLESNEKPSSSSSNEDNPEVNEENADGSKRHPAETPRAYRLRHRKVYLRPSCEIVLPKHHH